MLQQTTPSRDALLRSLDMFQPLNDEALSDIATQSRILRLKRNQVLFDKGDHLDGFFGLTEGKLKIYVLSCSGHERVIRILNAGNCFGEAIMFNDIPSPVRVEALTGSEVLFFPKSSVIDTLLNRPEMTLAMLKAMSRVMQELIQDVEDCCTRSARQRIAHYLVVQSGRAAVPYSEVELPASKAVVASTLNLSAETFSRELHNFSHEGLITVSRRIIYLHEVDRLRAIADPVAELP